MEAKYSIGQPLVVKATGEIVTPSAVRVGLKSVLYTVFSDGKKIIYKEDALESYEDPDSLLLEKIESNEIMNADEFRNIIISICFRKTRKRIFIVIRETK